MKAINIKLATFSFAAMLLASCSDSNSDGSSAISEMNTKIVGTELAQSPSAQELASRVFNFKSTVTSKSRTIDESNKSEFEGIISMPDEPTIPINAIELPTSGYDLASGIYYIPEGKTVEVNHPYGDCTLYVAGTFIQNGANVNENTKIYILHTGTWQTSYQELFNGNATVYNYGIIKPTTTGTSFTLKGTVLNQGDFIYDKELNIQGKCYIGGNLKAAKLSNAGMRLNVKGNCDLGDSEFKLNGSGNKWHKDPSAGIMNVDGTFTAGSAEFCASSEFYSGCAVKIAGDVNINSDSKVSVSYLKAKNIIQSSGTAFILKDQSFIECETYTDHNAGSQATSDAQNAESVLLGDKAKAVIKADKFAFNTGAPLENGTQKYDCFMFRTPGTNAKIVLDGKFYKKDFSTEILPYFPGQQIYWASDAGNIQDVVINKTECNGNTEWKPKKEDPKDPIIPISVIESDHTHDISATCVQPYGGKMYMSYHTRGDGHGSCIEVFDPVNNQKQVQLRQFISDKDKMLDWNHLMVYHEGNKKQVYVVGNHYKKAGALGYIDIASNGLLNTADTTLTVDGQTKVIKPLNILPLDANEKATDENCIVYDNKSNRFIVMTTKGYVTYDPETLNEIEKVDKPGKAKHVAIGDGKIVTLVFTKQAQYNQITNPTEAAKEWIDAQLEVRDRDAEMGSAPKLTITTPAVLPHYGKNSIVVKNSKIYVCLGAAGLYCYDSNSGAELGHYQMPSPIIQDSKEGKVGNYKAYANGVYVGDDNKVYIAYGSYGVVVLKAGTLEAGNPETIAHVQEGKSANYITVYNGYIYVAYGQKRLQVYQLVENGASSADVNTKQ